MDHRPSRRDIIRYYSCTYGNGPDDWSAMNRMLKECESHTKEQEVAYWKKLIHEYNDAVDSGKYVPPVSSGDTTDDFARMIGYDDLAFARD